MNPAPPPSQIDRNRLPPIYRPLSPPAVARHQENPRLDILFPYRNQLLDRDRVDVPSYDDDTRWIKERANIKARDADVRGPTRTTLGGGRAGGRKQDSDEDDPEREGDEDENVQIKIMPGGRVRVGGTEIHVQNGRSGLNGTRDFDDMKSTWTTSTGKQSQRGATWDRAMTQTMNSGFASGTPRTMGRKGVREGREKEVLGRRKTHGVGRTGKGPAPVPKGMLRALGVPESKDEIYYGESGAESVSGNAFKNDGYQSDVEDVFERRRQARAVKFLDDDYGNKRAELLNPNPKSPFPGEAAPQRSISERRGELEPNKWVAGQGSGYEYINWGLKGAQELKEMIDAGLVLYPHQATWPSGPPHIRRRISMSDSSDGGDSDAKRKRRVSASKHRATVLSYRDLDKAEAKKKGNMARAEQERLQRTRRDEAAWADCSSSDSDEYQDAQERRIWKRQDHKEPSWLASLVPEKWRPKWSWIAE